MVFNSTVAAEGVDELSTVENMGPSLSAGSRVAVSRRLIVFSGIRRLLPSSARIAPLAVVVVRGRRSLRQDGIVLFSFEVQPLTNTLEILPLAALAKSGSACKSKQYEKYPILMAHGHRLTSASAAASWGFMSAV